MQGSTPVDVGDVKPGDLIAGKYRIVRLIGEGGMGFIAEAVHEALGQRVAIKFHRPRSTDAAESVARFLREAKASAQIRSEHVVRVSDVAMMDSGHPYFVMEYLEGRDLDAVIQTDGPLTIPVGLDYTLQVCEALAEAHSLGIVHRDLKPANLFLSHRADGSGVVKLLDFGISKTLPRGDDATLGMTKTRALMGSPLYMAPEQMRSTRQVDQRADIWSLGVLMHEMLTGETPFQGETLPEVCSSIAADDPIPLSAKRHDAPPELEEVILRCLEKDPDHRFADVAELAVALAPLAPPEAARSIGRIVRILGGGARTTPPPPASLRASSPSLRPRVSIAPSSARSSAAEASDGETLFLEPSDQRRSGVAPTMKPRRPPPGRPESTAATMSDQVTATVRVSPASRATTFIAGGLAFMAATAIFTLFFRLYLGRSPTPPRSVATTVSALTVAATATAAAPAASPPATTATSAASTAPAPAAQPTGPIIELVDVPGTTSARPRTRNRPSYTVPPTSSLAKGDRAARTAPASPAGKTAEPSAAPSPTSAFGASRD